MENRVAGYPTQLAPHLELRRVLGEGGSSVVFEAFHTRLKVPVAVKLLSVRGALAQQARARLLREAELYALLDDPRIPRVYDVDELPDGTPFVVMEFVPGSSLESLVLGGPLSSQRAVGIAQQVLAALAYVHSRGVLHRDVKPANVILCETGDKCHVRLVDFGIAKISDVADQTLTQQGTIVGTPHYMAPERLLGMEAGERADIYSVGVMLYEMLCGVVPFGGPTLGETIASVLRDDPLPLRARAPHLSPELEKIVARAMARHAQARFASAVDMLRALNDVAGIFNGEASSPRIVSLPDAFQAEASSPRIVSLPEAFKGEASSPRIVARPEAFKGEASSPRIVPAPRQLALQSLELRSDDLHTVRRPSRSAAPVLFGLAGAALLGWMLWPGAMADLRGQQSEAQLPPPAEAAAPVEAAPSVDVPTMALAAPPAEPQQLPAEPAAPAAPTEPSPTGLANRFSGQFAHALAGSHGLGEVLGRVESGAAAPLPPEAIVSAEPNAAPPRPAASAQPAQSEPKQARPRAEREEELDEYVPPPAPAASSADYAPVKAMPLQPWLDQLDKLLKEPPPPPPPAEAHPEPARARRGAREPAVVLPANPY